MTDKYIAVVVYNTRIEDIGSLATFLQVMEDRREVRLLLYDNSGGEMEACNRDYCERELDPDRVCYRANEKNEGLSRVYNQAFADAAVLSGTEDFWLMLADDDTWFSADYLVRSIEAADEGVTDLICGCLPGISPIRSQRLWNRSGDNLVREAGIYENIYAVNSGLWIRRRVFCAVGGFEEALFLDMVDFLMMDRLTAGGLNRIRLVEGEIRQKFSAETDTDREALLVRFRIFRRDFVTYCRLTGRSSLYCFAVVTKRWIRVIMKCQRRPR